MINYDASSDRNSSPALNATDGSWNAIDSDEIMKLNSAPNGVDSLQETMREFRYVTLVFYLFTFIVGFAGNTLVLYVIGRYPTIRRKSVANYYIWNLSLADVLCVLTLPLFCLATYM